MKTLITKKKRKISKDITKTKAKKEEFIISPTNEWKLLYSPLMNGSQSRPSAEEKDLCWNCQNHETCTYPKPEGGVWHCKDYKWEAK